MSKKEGGRSIDEASKKISEKSRRLGAKEFQLRNKENYLIAEREKIKESINELNEAKKHLISESELKKTMMNSFLEEWESCFHQLQVAKQEIQDLIKKSQEIIHSDLQELYKKEKEIENKRLPKIKSHDHRNPKEYHAHVKKLKEILKKQVETNKKIKIKKAKPISINELIKSIENLIMLGNAGQARKEIKRAEELVRKIKDKNKKKLLNYEIQDLKTSVKLAEVAL